MYRFRSVPLLLLIASTGCASAPADRSGLATTASPSAVRVFERAIELGIQTAHGERRTDVLCVATRSPDDSAPVSWRESFGDPPSAVVAALLEKHESVRPYSACEIESLRAPSDRSSLVYERSTGARGLLLWSERADILNTDQVRIGYYENGLSAAEWRCSVRRQGGTIAVEECELVSIS